MSSGLRKKRAFTLVELLIVIGIIGVLIGILMPALAGVRARANSIKCQANLRQCGLYLLTYTNEWKGWYFPPNLGANMPRDKRWPNAVFKPPIWNPPWMLCPSDEMPAEEHSYLLNDHLHLRKIRAHTRDLGGLSSTEIVLMGEKRSDYPDYYMNRTDYPTRVEPHRHGIQYGSNYLFLDGHVDTLHKAQSLKGIDPWDVPTTAPATVPAP